MAKATSRSNELGHHLKLLRIKNNLTMTQTAEVTGITQGYISQIENGIYTPSAKTLAKLARAYTVPEIHLLRKAGIVQANSAAMQPDTGSGLTAINDTDPLAEVSSPGELIEMLKRGLASLDFLTDQIRQRGQVSALPTAPVATPEGQQELSAEMSLPVYDASWQPQTNFMGEQAGFKLPAHLCADDPEAFVLLAPDAAMAPRIQLGDWVVISPASEPENGNVVAINDRNSIQLRSFSRSGDIVSLAPLNPEFAHKTLIIDTGKDKFELAGVAQRVVNHEL